MLIRNFHTVFPTHSHAECLVTPSVGFSNLKITDNEKQSESKEKNQCGNLFRSFALCNHLHADCRLTASVGFSNLKITENEKQSERKEKISVGTCSGASLFALILTLSV